MKHIWPFKFVLSNKEQNKLGCARPHSGFTMKFSYHINYEFPIRFPFSERDKENSFPIKISYQIYQTLSQSEYNVWEKK